MKKSVLGVMAIAMLLIVGLIAPATATTGAVEAEPVPDTLMLDDELETQRRPPSYSGTTTLIWDGKGAQECPTGHQFNVTPGGNTDISNPTMNEPFIVKKGSQGAVLLETSAQGRIGETSVTFDWTSNLEDPNFVFTSSHCLEGVLPGGLRVNKSVVGEYDGDDFGFRVRCNDEAGTDVEFSLPANERHFVGRFDAGTICAVEEIESQGADTVTINGSQTMSERFTIVSGEMTDVYVVNTFDGDEPGTVTVTLMKQWFNSAGQRISPPSDAVFTLELFEGNDTEPSAILTQGDDSAATATLTRLPENGMLGAARYGVQETITGDRFTPVECSELAGFVRYDDVVNINTSAIQATLTPEEGGGFGTTDSGVHIVCNLVRAESVSPPSRPPSGPPAGPPPAVLPVPPVDAVEPIITPDPVEEPVVLPTEPIEREPEVVTPAPEVVEPVVEVRGETVTRTTPTRIDSGTGGSLDNSGLLALLLVGGLALSGFGITSAATARRRR